jgi:hypothetical protein
MRSGLLVCALMLGLTACSDGQAGSASGTRGSASATSAPAARPAPSFRPAATATPPSSGLVLSGALSGRSSAMQSTGACGATGGGYSALLAVVMSGQSYGLTIEIFDYRGPGRYSVPPERISLRGPDGDVPPLYPAVSGTIDVDSTGRSGSLDVSLSGPGGAGRLTGAWAC